VSGRPPDEPAAGPDREAETAVLFDLPSVPFPDPGEPAALPVLLVEDDPDGRQALGELLRMWGYAVEVAVDGEEAVAKVSRRPPRVALVDVGLPGIDGHEVARCIRRRYPDEAPLLIAMTGFGQPEDRRRALDAGFDLHLVKPVNPRKLSALLAQACRRE